MKASALKHHIAYCRLNERDSQKKIYNSYFNEAKLVCEQYTQDDQDLIIIIKEAFRSMFTSIGHFKPEPGNWVQSFENWSRKIMIRTAIDHFRNHYRHDLFIELNSTIIAASIETASPAGKPSAAQVDAALKKLSPAYRIFLKLALVEKLDYRDIAECLNIAVETAETGFLRARSSLQKLVSA